MMAISFHYFEQALHQRLGQGSDSQTEPTQDHLIGYNTDRSLPVLPQRERTIIGGDSQQDVKL